MDEIKKIVVIDAGAWGTALAILLGNKFKGSDKQIYFWVDPEIKVGNKTLTDEIKETRINQKLPKVRVPENVIISGDFEEVLSDANLIISVFPSVKCEEKFNQMKPFVNKQALFLHGTKGLVNGDTISALLEKTFEIDESQIGVISGPNIAKEIAMNFAGQLNPSFSTIACVDEKNRGIMKKILDFPPHLKLSCSGDVKGVELCGVLKQPYAMALGIVIGLGYTTNTIAGFFMLCGKEIKEIMNKLAKIDPDFSSISPKTYDCCFAGYPDLEVTKRARNGRAGRMIGQGKTKEQVLKEFKGQAIEGFRIIEVLDRNNKERLHLELPILEKVNNIINKQVSAKEGIKELFSNGVE